MNQSLSDPDTIGVWLQKKNRKALSGKYLSFEKINKVVHQYWNNL